MNILKSHHREFEKNLLVFMTGETPGGAETDKPKQDDQGKVDSVKLDIDAAKNKGFEEIQKYEDETGHTNSTFKEQFTSKIDQIHEEYKKAKENLNIKTMLSNSDNWDFSNVEDLNDTEYKVKLAKKLLECGYSKKVNVKITSEPDDLLGNSVAITLNNKKFENSNFTKYNNEAFDHALNKITKIEHENSIHANEVIQKAQTTVERLTEQLKERKEKRGKYEEAIHRMANEIQEISGDVTIASKNIKQLKTGEENIIEIKNKNGDIVAKINTTVGKEECELTITSSGSEGDTFAQSFNSPQKLAQFTKKNINIINHNNKDIGKIPEQINKATAALKEATAALEPELNEIKIAVKPFNLNTENSTLKQENGNSIQSIPISDEENNEVGALDINLATGEYVIKNSEGEIFKKTINIKEIAAAMNNFTNEFLAKSPSQKKLERDRIEKDIMTLKEENPKAYADFKNKYKEKFRGSNSEKETWDNVTNFETDWLDRYNQIAELDKDVVNEGLSDKSAWKNIEKQIIAEIKNKMTVSNEEIKEAVDSLTDRQLKALQEVNVTGFNVVLKEKRVVSPENITEYVQTGIKDMPSLVKTIPKETLAKLIKLENSRETKNGQLQINLAFNVSKEARVDEKLFAERKEAVNKTIDQLGKGIKGYTLKEISGADYTDENSTHDIAIVQNGDAIGILRIKVGDQSIEIGDESAKRVLVKNLKPELVANFLQNKAEVVAGNLNLISEEKILVAQAAPEKTEAVFKQSTFGWKDFVNFTKSIFGKKDSPPVVHFSMKEKEEGQFIAKSEIETDEGSI